MLRGKATLPLWFEFKHNYVGPAVLEIIPSQKAYAAHGFLAVGLFLGLKSKISHEQNVKEFQYYICMLNFSFLESLIKRVPQTSRSPS